MNGGDVLPGIDPKDERPRTTDTADLEGAWFAAETALPGSHRITRLFRDDDDGRGWWTVWAAGDPDWRTLAGHGPTPTQALDSLRRFAESGRGRRPQP